MPQNSGARLQSAGSENFFALCAVGANPSANNVHDWGFTLVPADALTTQAVVGWGPGSSDLTQNGSPVWVSPETATRVYVDYNGDGNGLLTDPNGGKYDAHYDLAAYESKTIYDPDKDQTAMRVYTLDGVLFATAWGQDPAVSGAGNPFLDLGTTVLPIPLPVIRKSSRIITDIGASGLSIGDILEYRVEIDNKGLLPLGNTLVVDTLPAAITYQPNTSQWNGNPIADDTVGTTIFPLDETGYTIPVILRGGTSVFTYNVQINNSGTIRNTITAAGYGLLYDHEIVVPPPAGSNPCTVDFTDAAAPVGAYQENAPVYVRLTDADANTNAATAQTLTLTVKNDTQGDVETVLLTETGPNTGVFQSAALPASSTTGLGVEDGTLHARPGDTLSVLYIDALFGDSCGDTAGIAVPSEIKPLYLNTDGGDDDTTGAMDRVDPVAAGDNTTSQTVALNGGSTVAVDASGSISGNVTQTAPVFSSQTTTSGSNSTYTFSHTPGVGANKLLMVSVSLRDAGATVSSVTFGGTPLTFVNSGTRGTGAARLLVAIYRLVAPANGPANVVVTLSETADGAVIGASTYTGVNQTTPLGAFVTANGSSTAPTVDAASKSRDLVYDTVASAVTGTNLVPDASQTERWDVTSGTSIRSASSTETNDAVTTTMSWTAGNGNWVIGAVPIKPLAATVTLSHTTGTGGNRLMLVGVSYEDDDENGLEAASVTYAGNPLTQVIRRVQNEVISEIWSLVNPPSGTANVLVNFNGAGATQDSAVVGATTFTGVNQSTPLGTAAGAIGNATTLSVNVSSEAGGMVFDNLAVDDGRVATVGGGQAQRWNLRTEAGVDGVTGAGSTEPGAATVTMSWTWVNTDWGALCAVPVRPAPAGTTLATFTQSPALCENLFLPVGGAINVIAHANVTSGSMPAGANVTARLKYGATTFFTDTSAVWNSGAGTLTWDGTLPSNVTIPSGQAVVLEVETAQSGVEFRVEYDSQTRPSRVSLPTTTVINVDLLGVYDAPYSGGGGGLVASANTGDTLYIRAAVSDPFGSYDITDLDLAVNGPGGVGSFSATLDGLDVVADDGCTKVYEYAWVTSAPQGAYEIVVTANEGTEGITDTASTSVTLSFQDLGTPSMTEFTTGDNGPHTLTYAPGETVCVRVTDLDQNKNPAAAETVTVTITTSGGDIQSNVVLTETGLDTGVFSGCVTADGVTDGGDEDGILYTPQGTLLEVFYTDPDDPTDQSGDTATVPSSTPALSVTKLLASPVDGQARVGEAVQFTIQVTNTGNAALPTVSLTDLFPAASLTYVSASPAPTATGAGTLSWANIGPLAVGQSVAVSVSFTAAASTASAVNSATADAGGGVTDTDSDDVRITNPSLSVTKTLVSPNPGPANYGTNVVFQIVVTNTGDSDIETLPLEDTYSNAFFQYVSASIPPDSIAAGSLLWLDLTGAGALAPGNSVTIDLTLSVVGAGNPATNTADVSFAEDEYGDPVPPDSDDATIVTLASSITGTVYDDLNQSGGLNAGEPGLPGVTMYLYTDPDGNGDPSDGVLVQVTTTNGAGYYEFVNLPADFYVVVQTDLPGYGSSGDTSAPNDNRIPVDASASGAFAGNDFFDYLVPPATYATVSGTSWNDLNGNGAFDGGEPGIPGTSIALVSDLNGNGIADLGEPVLSTVDTDANGAYVFTGVVPGNYVVVETDRPGFASSGDTGGVNDNQIGVVALASQTSGGNDFFNVALPPISLVKTANQVNYDAAGDVLTYSFTVTNTGSTNLTNITLADAVPGVTITGGPIALLVPGQSDSTTFSASYTVTQSDVDAGEFTNTATVTGTPPSGPDVSDSDDETVPAAQSAAITLTKTADQANYDASGDVLTYTLTVTNNGNVTLSNVTEDPDGDPVADTDDETVPAAQSAAITLTKTADQANYDSAGDVLTYTLTVTNNGNVTLSNVTVTDPTAVVTGGPLASLAPGASDSTTFSASYTVTQSDVDAGSFTNTASVDAEDPDGDPVADTDDETVPAAQSAAITFVKTGLYLDATMDGMPNVGDEITYTFTVTNIGNVTLSNVTVSDALVTVTGGPIATLLPGASDTTTFTATYAVTQADLDSGSLVNTASVDADDPDGDPVTDDDDDVQNFVITTVSGHLYNDVNNNGAQDLGETDLAGVDVIITDSIGNTRTATTDALGNWTAQVPPGTTQADVDETDPDFPSGAIQTEGTDPTTVDAVPGVDTFTDNDGYHLGGVIIGHLYLDVNNNGVQDSGEPDLADVDVIVTDSLGNTQTVTTNAFGNWSANVPVGVTTADVDETDPDFPSGAVQTEGTDPTTVTVVPITETFTDNDGYHVSPGAPGITVTKTASPAVYAAIGDVITYTVEVRNTGAVTLTDVLVTDPLAGLSETIASLVPGETATFFPTITIGRAEIDAGSVVNTASATGTPPSGPPVTDTDDETVTSVCDGTAAVSGTVLLAGTLTPIANVPVTLVPQGGTVGPVLLQVTGADGAYLFDGLTPGAYLVQVQDANLNSASGLYPAGSSLFFTTLESCDPQEKDFAYEPYALPVLGDFVWYDANNNGLQDEWFDANGDGLVTENVPDARGRVNFQEWEWIDLNGDGDHSGPANEGELNKCGVGNALSANIRVTGPNGYEETSIVGLLGYWRVRPGQADPWGEYTAELVVDEPLLDAVRALAATGLCRTLPAGKMDAAPAEKAAGLGCVPSTGVFKTGSVSISEPAILTLDFGIFCGMLTPALDVTKTASPSGYDSVGDVITYTITVANTGNVALTDVVVTDPLTGLSDTIPSLAPGASQLYTQTYAVTQADLDAGSVPNTASASGLDQDGDPVGDTDDETVTAVKNASIVLSKTANQASYAVVGDVLTYTLTVANTGNVTLYNVTVSDPDAVVTGGPLASLAPGVTDSTTFSASYTVTQADIDAGSFTNTAAVAAEDPDGEPVSDTDAELVSGPVPGPSLALVKSANPVVYTAVGQTISYSYLVANNGNVTLYWPFAVVDDKIASVDCSSAPASLAPGGSFTCTGVYTVTQADMNAGSVVNTAVATGEDGSGNPVTSAPDDETVTAVQTPSLSVTKTASPSSYDSVGDVITYTIVVLNTGNVTLTNVSVTDPLTGLAANIASLAPGASQTYTQTHTVTQSDLNAGSVVNTASATGTPPSGPPVGDTDDETVTAVQTPSLSVTKTGPRAARRWATRTTRR